MYAALELALICASFFICFLIFLTSCREYAILLSIIAHILAACTIGSDFRDQSAVEFAHDIALAIVICGAIFGAWFMIDLIYAYSEACAHDIVYRLANDAASTAIAVALLAIASAGAFLTLKHAIYAAIVMGSYVMRAIRG